MSVHFYVCLTFVVVLSISSKVQNRFGKFPAPTSVGITVGMVSDDTTRYMT